jgi:hypothetical protein
LPAPPVAPSQELVRFQLYFWLATTSVTTQKYYYFLNIYHISLSFSNSFGSFMPMLCFLSKVETCVLYLKAHGECQERAEYGSTSDRDDDDDDDDDDDNDALDNKWAFAHIGGVYTDVMSSTPFPNVAEKLGSLNLDDSNLYSGQLGNNEKTTSQR